MAEITRRRQGELVRKVFEILIQHPDGLPAKTVLDEVERALPPTDFERSTYPAHPQIRRFEKIVRFSTIGPVKAGWVVKNKGIWSVTDAGREAYDRFKDPEAFMRESGRLYRQWRANLPDAEEELVEDSPDTSTTFEEAQETAWAEIGKYLSKISPYDLQKLVAALLRAMGYHVSWIAPPGPDAGIDIVAHTDPLGTQSPRIKVQVKRREGRIAVDGLRAFMATLGDQDVGIFVSTGGFTSDAEAEARSQEKRKITLIGLEQLFDLWVEHYSKIPDEEKLLLPIKPVYFLAPAE
jgi:restriction system protein